MLGIANRARAAKTTCSPRKSTANTPTRCGARGAVCQHRGPDPLAAAGDPQRRPGHPATQHPVGRQRLSLSRRRRRQFAGLSRGRATSHVAVDSTSRATNAHRSSSRSLSSGPSRTRLSRDSSCAASPRASLVRACPPRAALSLGSPLGGPRQSRSSSSRTFSFPWPTCRPTRCLTQSKRSGSGSTTTATTSWTLARYSWPAGLGAARAC